MNGIGSIRLRCLHHNVYWQAFCVVRSLCLPFLAHFSLEIECHGLVLRFGIEDLGCL
jgi:hypothetical protein